MGSAGAETGTVATHSRHWPVPSGWPGRPVAGGRGLPPLVALIGGAVLVAVGAGWVAAHVTVWALDETLIEQSAVHYSSALHHSLFHDLDARATSRLYPLVLSVAFRFLHGAQAIRVDHVISAVLFVSVVIPVYWMGRVLLRSRWSAVAAALLSAAAPWLTITSALFEENLAYPLFWWTLLACCYAVWRPRARNDAAALAAIALLIVTRAEFTSVLLGYFVAVVVVSALRVGGHRRLGARALAAVREAAPRHPFLLAVCVVGFPVLLYLALATTSLEQFLGTYSNVVYRTSVLPPNMAEALLVELIALALGVGLLPALVSIPWFLRRMAKPQLERGGVYLLCAGAMLGVFVVFTAYSQGGYLGVGTEERYFFYVVPVFWLGAFAALEQRGVSASDIALCGVVLAALYGAIPFLAPLSQETAFLAPVESVVPHVLQQRLSELGGWGLTSQDALAVLAALAAAVTALVWRRSTRARLWWTCGAAAVVQLLVTGYAFAVVDGKVPGISGRTSGSVSALGWVDAHARVADVAWLENQPTGTTTAGGVSASVTSMRTVLFWNSHLLSWAWVEQLGLPLPQWPMSALPPVLGLQINTTTGALTGVEASARLREIVSYQRSPFLQLAGTTLGQSPEHTFKLTASAYPLRATWLATGLAPDGAVAGPVGASMFAFAPRGGRTAEAVTLTLAAAPSQAGVTQPVSSTIAVQLGTTRRTVVLRSGAPPRQVSLVACFASADPVVSGRLRPVSPAGAASNAVLSSVSLGAASAQQSSSCSR